MAHDVFISYSQQDETVANAIVAGLESEGIRCWITPRDVTPSDTGSNVIINAITGAQIMVIILSEKSNQSKQVLREVERAVDNGLILIPFRVEDMQPFGAMAYFLSSEHWLDAMTPPLEQHIQKLINIIRVYQDEEDKYVHTPEHSEKQKMKAGPKKGLRNIFGLHKKETPQETTNQIHQENIGEQLKVIETIQVKSSKSQGVIRFCVGDLTKVCPDERVDVLTLWSVRDSYLPLPGSLIKQLDKIGISVEALAMDKEVDLRQAFSCWLSREIKNPNIAFKRILCYEPEESAKAAELVGDIFRSIAPFIGGSHPIRTVSTPLLASGQLMKNKKVMLQQLVEAAVHWMSSGFPLDCFNIVTLPDKRLDELIQLFSDLKNQYTYKAPQKQDQFSYDFFISYSHQDAREVNTFMDILQSQDEDLRIFIDKNNLNPGAAWQQEIFEAIDDCQKVATFYSPTYLDSKVCLEEFNIALCRHRESDQPVLTPIYLYSAQLPTYMRMIQFFDCREFNQNKLQNAARDLITRINE